MATYTKVTHWLPIVTFCPVNNLPDLIYIQCTFPGFEELYAVRKKIRKIIQWRKLYMETVCEEIQKAFPHAIAVEVSLLFGRHTVLFTEE
jgi:hypothetical protein